MHKILTAVVCLYFISSEALADRLANSTFTQGVISSIQNCKAKNAGAKSSVSIKTKTGQSIKGSINSHTQLSEKCSKFKKGTRVVVGYTQGDDSGIFSSGYQVIDSISIK